MLVLCGKALLADYLCACVVWLGGLASRLLVCLCCVAGALLADYLCACVVWLGPC